MCVCVCVCVCVYVCVCVCVCVCMCVCVATYSSDVPEREGLVSRASDQRIGVGEEVDGIH